MLGAAASFALFESLPSPFPNTKGRWLLVAYAAAVVITGGEWLCVRPSSESGECEDLLTREFAGVLPQFTEVLEMVQ
jgi:hypothetical protein